MKKARAEIVSSLLFWWCFYSCSSLSFAVETDPGLLKKFLSYKLRKVKICSKIFWARISKAALVLGYTRAVRPVTAKHKRTAEAKALTKAVMVFTVNFAMLDFSTTTIFLSAVTLCCLFSFSWLSWNACLVFFYKAGFQFSIGFSSERNGTVSFSLMVPQGSPGAVWRAVPRTERNTQTTQESRTRKRYVPPGLTSILKCPCALIHG